MRRLTHIPILAEYITPKLRERFASRVHIDMRARDEYRCHLWTGAQNSSGHGVIVIDGEKLAAHRVAWALAGRDLPDGQLLYHTCEDRACVRVEHLRPVSLQEIAKMNNAGRMKLECVHGHDLTNPENLYWLPNNSRRECKVCRQARAKRNWQRLLERRRLRNTVTDDVLV